MKQTGKLEKDESQELRLVFFYKYFINLMFKFYVQMLYNSYMNFVS